MRMFVQFGLTTALLRREMQKQIRPQADFDLLYLVEILRSMAASQKALETIVSGDFESLKWWPDD